MYRDFKNVKELIEYIDAKIAEYKRQLGEMISKSDEIRRIHEALKSINQRIGIKESAKHVEGRIGDVRLIIVPVPEIMRDIYETYSESLSRRINKLVEIRKYLETLAGYELPIRVFMSSDIPEVIVIKTETS
jgi:sugar-specific transcriptional regulator TrmB